MSPCHGCHSLCCRIFAVPVSGADILSIERHLELDFWDFVCRWADADGRIARGYAPQFLFDDEPQTPFTLCLKQESSDGVGGRRCRFLREEPAESGQILGSATCGIYSDRPMACRIFPAILDGASGLLTLEENPPVTDDGMQVCPEAWTDADLDFVETHRALLVAREEMQFFQQLAEVWNRQPGEWAAFPEFLREVYARRLSVDLPESSSRYDDRPATIKLPTVHDQPRRKAA